MEQQAARFVNDRLHHGLPPLRGLVRLVLRYYLSPRCARAELRRLRQWRLRKRYNGQAEGGASHLRVTVTQARFVPSW